MSGMENALCSTWCPGPETLGKCSGLSAGNAGRVLPARKGKYEALRLALASQGPHLFSNFGHYQA
eukprot:1258292-Amphidinium_carterae.1